MAKNVSIDDLDGLENEKNTTVEMVFEQLGVTHKGLTTQEVESRTAIFGMNMLPEKHINPILQFLSFMWNPLSWVMEVAALVAILVSNGPRESTDVPPYPPPDYPDFIGIVLLLIVNATIGFIEERNAGDAVAALKAALAPNSMALRDGKWATIEAKTLVPGDIISIKLGDVVPADSRIFDCATQLKVDQAALTGESLPVSKEKGDSVYSGSTIKQGEAECVVIATGIHSFFGKAAHLVDSTEASSHFQQVLARIGQFCIVIIGSFMVLEAIVMYAAQGYLYRLGIDNLLTILIGGVPIAMPTVLSVTLAIGAAELAEKKAIVTRITAIEELAGMTMLCSDKTGTLTLNKLTINKETFKLYSNVGIEQCMSYAAYASRTINMDAIDTTILQFVGGGNGMEFMEPGIAKAREGIEELHFHPFDPTGKRTEITFRNKADGKVWQVSKGAPHIILDISHNAKEIGKAVHKDIDELAGRGFRSLGLCRREILETNYVKAMEDPKATGWELLAMIPIYDPPRHDTKETIDRAIVLGVSVKMITGDQLAIAKETGRLLGMGPNMYNAHDLFGKGGIDAERQINGVPLGKIVQDADGFAGVFPEDKYALVAVCQKIGNVVGMTGDGVNDAPALKVADIGIAVADATDAARGASDIVLTEPGLSVIIDAMIGSRRIFQRMTNYSIYACSTTVGIVVRFCLLVWIFKFNMPPFMILVLAYLNDGTILTISKDRVIHSPHPDKWDLQFIFIMAVVLGLYMTFSTVILVFMMNKTDFFTSRWPTGLNSVFTLRDWTGNSPAVALTTGFKNNGINDAVFHSVIYLQTSVLGQALIFVTRSRGPFFLDRPGTLLMGAFVIAQVVATFIAVYADWPFTNIAPIGWGWAGVCWIYNFLWFFPMDVLKLAVAASLTTKFNMNCWGVPELGQRGGMAMLSKKPEFTGAEGTKARHLASMSLQLHNKSSLGRASKMLVAGGGGH